MQISLNLLCVISQNLLKRADGKGRIASYEILNVLPSVRNLIREGKSHQIASILQTSQQQGMISFDACLANMVRNKVITREDAEKKALNQDTFHKEMEQLTKPV
jgi:twitching motility protein PilT